MKKFWKENRVLFLLILILIVCFVAICSVVISYFVGTHKSIYGDRFTDKIEIKKEDKNDYIKILEENELVESVVFKVPMRTIYIEINFVDSVSLEKAKEIAEASVENIDEELLAYYDINFTIKKEKTEKDEGFSLMGSKNFNGTGVSWNNNTVIKDTEEVEE